MAKQRRNGSSFRKDCYGLSCTICLIILLQFPIILLFSRSVVSNSLWPHNCSTSGLPVLHHLLELGQTHVHRVGDGIQPSHPERLIWRLLRMSSDSKRVCSTGCWVGCWLGRGALPECNNLQAENLAGNRGKVECLLSKWPDPDQASIVDFVQLNIKRKKKFPRKCQSSS